MSIQDSFTSALKRALNDSWQDLLKESGKLFKLICNNLEQASNQFLKEMIDFVLYTPTIAHDPIIFKLWSIVRIISFSLIGMMFVWEAFKNFFSIDNIISAVEFKTMLTRMIYGLIFAVFSLDIIDTMINFNQALIDTIRLNFTISLDRKLTVNSTFGFIMVLALMVVQVVLAVKLILQYWMRIAEIWLMAVIGPALYVLWINPSWGGYLKQWLSRLISTIGTTLIWTILFAIYSALVSLVAKTGMLVGFPTLGPIASMCLSIALLLTMHETPGFLRSFMSSQQSALDIMKNTAKDVATTTKLPINVAKKATGWLRRK